MSGGHPAHPLTSPKPAPMVKMTMSMMMMTMVRMMTIMSMTTMMAIMTKLKRRLITIGSIMRMVMKKVTLMMVLTISQSSSSGDDGVGNDHFPFQ